MSAFLHSLADVLGTTEAEARQALADFVEALHTRLDAEGEVAFEGLGTFRRAGGSLTFEAAPAVALVVNHRYAGMEPIPLSSGAPPRWQTGLPDDQHPLGPPPETVFETADTSPDDDGPDLPPLFASDETLMALRDAARDLDTPPSEEAAQWADEMIEEDSQIVPVDLSQPEEPEDVPPIDDASVIEEVVLSDPPSPSDDEGEAELLQEEDGLDDENDEVFEADEPALVFPPHGVVEHDAADAVPPPPVPAEVPPPPPASERPPRVRTPEPDEPRRNVWPFAALGVLVLIAAAVLLMRGWGRDDTPPSPVVTPDTAAVAPLDTATAPPRHRHYPGRYACFRTAACRRRPAAGHRARHCREWLHHRHRRRCLERSGGTARSAVPRARLPHRRDCRAHGHRRLHLPRRRRAVRLSRRGPACTQ